MRRLLTVCGLAFLLGFSGATAAKSPPLKPLDVFELEYTADPQISPDGRQIAYVRSSLDIMTDSVRRNIWTVAIDGQNHRPLLSGKDNFVSPRWSPEGRRLAYVTAADGSAQIYVRWMDTGQTARITNLVQAPQAIAWSPDGRWLAFTMFVPGESKPFIAPPAKPEGAKWADPVKVIDQTLYRGDGAGFFKPGYVHLFVVPAEGGSPRQLTTGNYHHAGTPSWTPDSKAIILSANRHDDAQYQPLNSEVYEVTVADGSLRAITNHLGPDDEATASPDGRLIAVTGFDDRRQGYQARQLYVMDRTGANRRSLTATLDRDATSPTWSADGRSLYFLYDDKGDTKLGRVTLEGKVTELATRLGGLDIGRPYGVAAFSLSKTNIPAFVATTPARPAELAVLTNQGSVRMLTALNEEVLGQRELGAVEEMWVKSSADGRPIQSWLVKPPGFDPSKKYPLVLEIHGGPFTNYGPRFSVEMQAYAAAGYVVLYVNPRGSTSYGETFGNLIHHAYPGQDYDDLMSAVDGAIAKGYVDTDNLFVTGGSGGGTLTAWITGKTNRFKAAVVAKPVINWTSWVLGSDLPTFGTLYWFEKFPWEDPEHYWKRSPLSLVANIKTPTMLLTGEADLRTPISETEQYYSALKLQKVDTIMIRVPDEPHALVTRPSHLIAKTQNIIGWFEKYRTRKTQ